MFILTDTQILLKNTCTNLAKKEIAPYSKHFDTNHSFPKLQIKKMASLGLLGMFIHEEDGGAGLDTLSYVLALEEISKACASCGIIMSVNNSLYCEPVMKFGTPEQKKTFLTPIIFRN